MAAAMVLSTQAVPVQAAPDETGDLSGGQEGVSEELIAQVSDYTGTATKVYADTYAEPGRNRNWREGMVSGNGENGVVTSGAPYSDTLIYQNINLIMPSDHPRKPLEVILSFTFHNVSINTENPDVSGVDFQNFTFHDISINTVYQIEKGNTFALYIPRCFY